MNPRLQFDYVKERIEKENYILLSTSYKNAHTKLLILCDKGHEYEASWDVFNRGCRCNICSTKRTANKQRHDIKYIETEFEKEGYELLSNEYKNAQTYLDVKCNKDHITSFSWNFFQGGGRCPKCFRTTKKTIKEIKLFSKSLGYELISTTYINALEKLKFKCPENHIFEASWNNFSGKNGSRCPVCWFIKNRGKRHHRWKGGISKEPYCDIFSDKEFKEYEEPEQN